MSHICLSQPDATMHCAVSDDKKDCVKPSENNIVDENQSADTTVVDAAVKSSMSVDNTVPPFHQGSSNSSPIKVKRRSKHRAGRNRKRRWEPYSKYEQREPLDYRINRRSEVNGEMTAYGLVVAPYNTTQFLMNDHNIQEPDYGHVHNGHKHREGDDHGDSSEDYYGCSDDDSYINQQFMEDYESFHHEYLDSLSQEQLVHQWVGLEDEVEALEKKLLNVQQEKKRRGSNTSNPDAEMEKIQVFIEEIRKITIENRELEKRNMELQQSLCCYS